MEAGFSECQNSEEEWENFHEKWRNVVYAKTEEAYTSAWTHLSNTYKNSYSTKVNYLYNTSLAPHCTKFVKCYTDSIRHYGNVVTS